ncbi:MAG: hypothetical protein F6K04_15370 [Leptolyngbya sp. SIO4C5]|nr:hypothetical protein [Leptolyngbya sp. SIO4C5]
MTFDAETLYRLLPAIYRSRDLEQGEPLQALVQVLAREIAVLETDLDQLYDDQFIETCAEWGVPYIGDLIGDRPLYTNLPGFPSARAAVANTIGYRRRKGTAAMLEQLGRDVTGWPARVAEFFELLATTQYMNHLRPHNLTTPDLRRWQPLAYLGSPFETTAHTAEMRRIPPRRGRYNIPNIGLFLWRLEPYTIGLFPSTARPVADPADGRYTFHPVGLDAPLFNPPLPELAFTLAQPINVPEPLRRRVLYEELESWRQAIASGQAFQPVYFAETSGTLAQTGDRQRVFDIFVDGAAEPIPPPEILICDLSNWRRPPMTQDYQPMPVEPTQSPVSLPIQVAVDPLLGRIAFPAAVVPEQIRLRYTYGFSADVGGGPYDRGDSVLPLLERPVTWQLGVSVDADPTDPAVVDTLSGAIAQWNSQPPGTFGIIAILDSQTYAEAFPTITIPAGSQLLIVAAEWPLVPVPDSPTPQRQIGQVTPEFLRPHLRGDLSVVGTAPDGSDIPGDVILNGLLIEGALTVQSGNLDRLQLDHCTLVPFTRSSPVATSLTVAADNSLLTLRLDHCLTGPISITATIEQLQVVASLVDGAAAIAIAADATPAEIQTSTLLGTTQVRSLEASNSIFAQLVTVQRRQTGCVRFSFLPLASQAPRRYRCQPNLALEELAKALKVKAITDPTQQEQVERRVSPDFTSKRYGDPAYAQLSQRCAVEIRQGADDEAEMGVFHDLYQPQRETNLRVRLDEYLRFGLEAGIFYIT